MLCLSGLLGLLNPTDNFTTLTQYFSQLSWVNYFAVGYMIIVYIYCVYTYKNYYYHVDSYKASLTYFYKENFYWNYLLAGKIIAIIGLLLYLCFLLIMLI